MFLFFKTLSIKSPLPQEGSSIKSGLFFINEINFFCNISFLVKY